MRRAVLAAGALVLSMSGSAGAVGFDFSDPTDRMAIITFSAEGESISYEVPVDFFDTQASTFVPGADWAPVVEAVSALGGITDVTNVSDYEFLFDLSGPTTELVSGGYTFDGVSVTPQIILPISFTSTTSTVTTSLGTKTGLILLTVETDQLLCDPAAETCETVTFSEDHDPLTGDLLGVGSLLGNTPFGAFELFLASEINLSEIPEPGSAALLLGAVTALALIRRRA
jgi:hypothetical protein